MSDHKLKYEKGQTLAIVDDEIDHGFEIGTVVEVITRIKGGREPGYVSSWQEYFVRDIKSHREAWVTEEDVESWFY